MTASNPAPHKPGIVPKGAKTWRIGWFIEVADGKGAPIEAPDDLRWAQCMAVAGGQMSVQRAAHQIGLSLSRHVAELSAQGDLQELAGEDKSSTQTG